jgi:hypothetical protein
LYVPAVKARLTWVAVLLIAGAGFAPAAHAAEARIVVVPALDLSQPAPFGAIGLAVPSVGNTISRGRALAALRSGRFHSQHLRERDPPVVALTFASAGAQALLQAREAARSGDVTILVAVPPPGSHANDRRYPVAVVGAGFAGELQSLSTRIPGLVTFADLAPTVLELSSRPIPDSVNGHVLTWRAGAGAPAALRKLDRDLFDSQRDRAGAAIAYAAILVCLAAAAILARSPFLARAALLTLPAAATASLALSLAGVWSWQPFAAATGTAALAGAATLRSPLALGLALTVAVFFQGVGAGIDTQALSLSLLGPNPSGGGRFYGFSNGLETVVLGTVVAVGALLWERLGTAVLMVAGALGVVVMASGRAGASVTGAIVVAVAYAVLSLRLAGLAGLLPLVVVGAAAAAVLEFAGPPHLAGAGGGRLVERIEISARLAVDSVQSVLLTFVVGLAPLVALALAYPRLRYRLDPTASAAVLAMLVALLVSLVLNDTPAAVLTNGVGWCLAVLAYGLVRFGQPDSGALYRLAPVCVGSPSLPLRSRRSR